MYIIDKKILLSYCLYFTQLFKLKQPYTIYSLGTPEILILLQKVCLEKPVLILFVCFENRFSCVLQVFLNPPEKKSLSSSLKDPIFLNFCQQMSKPTLTHLCMGCRAVEKDQTNPDTSQEFLKTDFVVSFFLTFDLGLKLNCSGKMYLVRSKCRY